jgi:hypothetical protein
VSPPAPPSPMPMLVRPTANVCGGSDQVAITRQRSAPAARTEPRRERELLDAMDEAGGVEAHEAYAARSLLPTAWATSRSDLMPGVSGSTCRWRTTRSSCDAPEWTRTTTRETPDKALNLIRPASMRSAPSSSSSLRALVSGFDGLTQVDVLRVFSRRPSAPAYHGPEAPPHRVDASVDVQTVEIAASRGRVGRTGRIGRCQSVVK